ncbi:MAG: hypothetical protein ABIA11_00280 [Patescibacteria group bacterium]|nr:hypothetical protein [Patescibacteria group bacterium]
MEPNNVNQSIGKNSSAASSFRTFILTLSISLIVFSAIYYVMSSSGMDTDVFENSLSDNSVTEESVKGTSSESVFGEIATREPETQARFVLAGTDEVEETTQSTTTVPETGILSVTTGLFGALIFFIAGIIVVALNPRKLALDTFEKTVTRE